MTLFEIWLIGWLITGSAATVVNCTPPPKVLSTGECITLNGVIAGAAWPIVIPLAIKESLE